VALTIKRAGADEYGRYIKVLLAGDPGSGKTRLSSTFPNPIYANIEGGLMSVVDRQPAYVDVQTSNDLDMLRTALVQSPRAREQLLSVPVNTVILDTLDSLQKILIAERLKEQHHESMAMQDWGWLGDMMRDIVRGFRNLDLHVVFTCHIRTVEDSETGAVLVKPALQGQMGDEIPAYVDLAVLLKARPENKLVDGQNVRSLARVMQTASDARHPWLKDRSGKLPMEFAVDLTTDFGRINELVFSAMAPPSTTEARIDVVPQASVKAADSKGGPLKSSRAKGDEKSSTNGDSAEPTAEVSPEPPAPTEPVEADPVPQPLSEDAGEARGPEQQESESETEQESASVPPTETVAVTDGNPELVCEQCGGQVENEDQMDLSRIRFRKVLCRKCFVEARAAKAR
jgi:hypothetical protein